MLNNLVRAYGFPGIFIRLIGQYFCWEVCQQGGRNRGTLLAHCGDLRLRMQAQQQDPEQLVRSLAQALA